ncbi:MAG: PD-(D/E)XK nuclease family protein [Bacteroidaceae bacterium]|nr:PD-(D/E)XK nuclease family protein [Bacteroidaceae bacterium]
MESIITDTQKFEDYSSILSLAEKYVAKKHEVINKYPYHVNPIEELHAKETANSRILCAMLRYQHNGEYKILKSFARKFITEFNSKLDIGTNPIIEAEQYRIDLSVREPGKYALIFENKIHDAVLQKNQLARYIRKLQTEEGFRLDQIYIVFLPSSKDYEPNDCSWHDWEECCDKCNQQECSLKYKKPKLREDFKNRYHTVTFRENVLNWLKEDVLLSVNENEVLLRSSVILYIDYLEGLFELRTNEKEMYMEIKDFIVERLNLNDEDLEGKINVLQKKKENIEKLNGEIEKLRVFYMQELIKEKLEPIVENIAKSKDLQYDLRICYDENRMFCIGFKKGDWDLYILFDCFTTYGMTFYIGKHFLEPISGYSCHKCINGWNVDDDKEKYPHGWEWLKKYENKILDLHRDVTVDDGAEFKRFLEDKLYRTLKEIEGHPNEITMKISSSQ